MAGRVDLVRDCTICCRACLAVAQFGQLGVTNARIDARFAVDDVKFGLAMPDQYHGFLFQGLLGLGGPGGNSISGGAGFSWVSYSPSMTVSRGPIG